MTTLAGHIESFLSGDLPHIDGTDEASWHSHWHEAGMGALPPVQMAVLGGLIARSLPQVFIAGYQAALRTVFPSIPDEGWAAFVAAEDRADPANHPGTTLTGAGEDLRLSGFKSWVGQSQHVTHLLVSARQDGADRIVSVNAGAAGITLTHRESPSFLSGLSQGFARFDDVSAQPVIGADMRTFGRTEPHFVMLACAAFLMAQADDDALRVRATTLTTALAAYSEAGSWSPKLLAAMDRELQAQVARFDGSSVPDWHADRRLFAMYSPRIQKRA